MNTYLIINKNWKPPQRGDVLERCYHCHKPIMIYDEWETIALRHYGERSVNSEMSYIAGLCSTCCRTRSEWDK